MENKNRTIEGWTKKNIIIGLALLCGGLVVDFLNTFFGLEILQKPAPLWYFLAAWTSLAMFILGVFGFWIVIPAFQKWGHTKPWLAIGWLVVSIAVLSLFFYSGRFTPPGW